MHCIYEIVNKSKRENIMGVEVPRGLSEPGKPTRGGGEKAAMGGHTLDHSILFPIIGRVFLINVLAEPVAVNV